jgi:hypothetical protein
VGGGEEESLRKTGFDAKGRLLGERVNGEKRLASSVIATRWTRLPLVVCPFTKTLCCDSPLPPMPPKLTWVDAPPSLSIDNGYEASDGERGGISSRMDDVNRLAKRIGRIREDRARVVPTEKWCKDTCGWWNNLVARVRMPMALAAYGADATRREGLVRYRHGKGLQLWL